MFDVDGTLVSRYPQDECVEGVVQELGFFADLAGSICQRRWWYGQVDSGRLCESILIYEIPHLRTESQQRRGAFHGHLQSGTWLGHWERVATRNDEMTVRCLSIIQAPGIPGISCQSVAKNQRQSSDETVNDGSTFFIRSTFGKFPTWKKKMLRSTWVALCRRRQLWRSTVVDVINVCKTEECDARLGEQRGKGRKMVASECATTKKFCRRGVQLSMRRTLHRKRPLSAVEEYRGKLQLFSKQC